MLVRRSMRGYFFCCESMVTIEVEKEIITVLSIPFRIKSVNLKLLYFPIYMYSKHKCIPRSTKLLKGNCMG